MSQTLQKLIISNIAIVAFLLAETGVCNGQQIIKIHDPLRQTNDYRYVWGRGETTLMLNSLKGNELYLYLKFSPEMTFPLYLVLFCYENKMADENSKVVFDFADGSSVTIRNTGKLNFSSMYLFDLTGDKDKFRNAEVENVHLIDGKGKSTDNYSFVEHSDYFINFFSLLQKMQNSYKLMAVSDTIK
ncbi:MAG: hypothetical protein ACM3ME_06285 [Chloroflexota bacterium]|nr:hypothetical protein [Bacteroidales bacterium]HLO92296.1 hypothetical protein [Lentimicrobium sp.]